MVSAHCQWGKHIPPALEIGSAIIAMPKPSSRSLSAGLAPRAATDAAHSPTTPNTCPSDAAPISAACKVLSAAIAVRNAVDYAVQRKPYQ